MEKSNPSLTNILDRLLLLEDEKDLRIRMQVLTGLRDELDVMIEKLPKKRSI